MSEKHYSNDWAKSRSRDLVREVIGRNVFGYRKPKDVRVLFFPGIDAQEVFEVYDPLGIPRENLVGIEMDRDIAEHVSQMGLGIRVVNKRLEDYVAEQGTSLCFDVFSLDYHNPVTQDQLKTLNSIAHSNQRNSFVLHHANLMRRDHRSRTCYLMGYVMAASGINTNEMGHFSSLEDQLERYHNIKVKIRGNEPIRDEKVESYSALIQGCFGGGNLESLDRTFVAVNKSEKEVFAQVAEVGLKLLFDIDCKLDPEHPLKSLGKKAYQPGVTRYFEELICTMLRARLSEMGIPEKMDLDPFARLLFDGHNEHRCFYINDIELYSYISESGAPMTGDIYFFRYPFQFKHVSSDFVRHFRDSDRTSMCKAAIKACKLEDRIIPLSLQDKMKEQKKIRQFLGNSSRPVLTKQRAIEEMKAGATIEDLQQKYRGTDRKPLAAWKAHVTMGTYQDNAEDSDSDLETITKQEAVELLSSGIPVDEVFDTYPTSFTKGQLRAFKAHVTMGSYKDAEENELITGNDQ